MKINFIVINKVNRRMIKEMDRGNAYIIMEISMKVYNFFKLIYNIIMKIVQ